MPQRYITIPEAVILRDPISRQSLKTKEGQDETLDFAGFLNKLFSHPKWSENYLNIKSAAAIEKAFADAKDSLMVLAEEDWKKLCDAAENPRTVLIHPTAGPQVQMGYGFHPTLSTQLLPLIEAIVQAKDKAPDGPTG